MRREAFFVAGHHIRKLERHARIYRKAEIEHMTDSRDDTRTELQRHALYELLKQLRQDYPKARIVGHCELPGTTKPCPCYLPSQEYKDLQPH